jgi:hypothetical protein
VTPLRSLRLERNVYWLLYGSLGSEHLSFEELALLFGMASYHRGRGPTIVSVPPLLQGFNLSEGESPVFAHV